MNTWQRFVFVVVPVVFAFNFIMVALGIPSELQMLALLPLGFALGMWAGS